MNNVIGALVIITFWLLTGDYTTSVYIKKMIRDLTPTKLARMSVLFALLGPIGMIIYLFITMIEGV